MPTPGINPASPFGLAEAKREKVIRRAIEGLLLDPFVVEALRHGAKINADSIRLERTNPEMAGPELAALGLIEPGALLQSRSDPPAPPAHPDIGDAFEPETPPEAPEIDVPFEALRPQKQAPRPF